MSEVEGGANSATLRLVRVGEAANMLGVGTTTVFRLIKDRQLRAVKIGTATRISTDELRAFVDRRTCGAA